MDNHLIEPQNENDDEILINKKAIFPEALPLINIKTNSSMLEPEIKYKMNRIKKETQNKKQKTDNQGATNQATSITYRNQQGIQCRHTKVKDYFCEECKQTLPKFQSIFDTGNISLFLNIKYVNEFMDKLDGNNLGLMPGKPKLIYECYKPKTTHEMREYILYSIDKSLKKLQKRGLIKSEHQKVIGQIGSIKNLSPELMSYIYLKKNRELQVLGYGNNQEDNAHLDHNQQAKFNCIGPRCLLFDSFFESGNLEKAEYVSDTEYNLYLNVDTNTKGHQQWFYFKVKNTFKDQKYTFNIRNFTKPFSLFRSGMRIMMRSKKQEEESELDAINQWTPIGENVCYWKSDIQRSGWRIPGPLNLDDDEDDDEILDDINGVDGTAAYGPNKAGGPRKSTFINSMLQNVKKRKRYFYCLTFQVEFDYDDDIVYFAYSIPYQYSKVYLELLDREQKLMESSDKVIESSDNLERLINTKDLTYSRKLLCKSISGLPVPIISLTAHASKGLDLKKRQAIVITARVHPGETNSNLVFDGLIDYLISSEGVTQLLQNYVFKLIPCLNPDGVVSGNYRSSLAGVDLNRQWVLPSKELHPTIFHAKDMIQKISKERQLLVFCDLHCHSKKKNAFIYGCNTAANGGFTSWTKVRLLPRVLARQTPLFNIKDCRFRIDPSKLGTARVIIWKEFAVTNSFTLENSFFGYKHGQDVIPFNQDHYRSIGENFGKSLVEYRMLLKQIERELILTNGWLKPKLLLQVTGVPAAQKLDEEHKQNQKNQKKKQYIEQYRNQLGLSKNKEQEEIAPFTFNEKTRNSIRAKTVDQQNLNNIHARSTDQDELIRNKNTINVNQKRINNNQKESSNESTKLQTLRFTTAISNDDKIEQDSANTSIILSESNNTQDKNLIKMQQIIQGKTNNQQNARRSVLPDIQNTKISPLKVLISHQQNKSCDDLIINNQIKADEDEINGAETPNWRKYFDKDELIRAYDDIQEGDDPNEMENISESDSDISQDNLDIKQLYNEIYMRSHLMDIELKMQNKAQEKIVKDIKILVESVRASKVNNSQKFIQNQLLLKQQNVKQINDQQKQQMQSNQRIQPSQSFNTIQKIQDQNMEQKMIQSIIPEQKQNKKNTLDNDRFIIKSQKSNKKRAEYIPNSKLQQYYNDTNESNSSFKGSQRRSASYLNTINNNTGALLPELGVINSQKKKSQRDFPQNIKNEQNNNTSNNSELNQFNSLNYGKLNMSPYQTHQQTQPKEDTSPFQVKSHPVNNQNQNQQKQQKQQFEISPLTINRAFSKAKSIQKQIEKQVIQSQPSSIYQSPTKHLQNNNQIAGVNTSQLLQLQPSVYQPNNNPLPSTPYQQNILSQSVYQGSLDDSIKARSSLSNTSKLSSQPKNDSGFSQYVLKNLRYEDQRIQMAYSKIKNLQNQVQKFDQSIAEYKNNSPSIINILERQQNNNSLLMNELSVSSRRKVTARDILGVNKRQNKMIDVNEQVNRIVQNQRQMIMQDQNKISLPILNKNSQMQVTQHAVNKETERRIQLASFGMFNNGKSKSLMPQSTSNKI